MSDNLEETSFDYIVLGTGLVESILAGSLARCGKKVLHIDSHQNYGGNWSVFGFRELAQWSLDMTKERLVSHIESDLNIDYEKSYASNFRNVEFNLHATELLSNEEPLISNTDKPLFDHYLKQENFSETLFADLLRSSRQYNLDSTPKLLESRESLVETLIRSGVGRYLEFKSVDDIYIFDKVSQVLERVPSSKEDVFTNKAVSLIEKRKLMKFLTFAMEYEQGSEVLQGTERMTYAELLADKFKITGKLQDAIIYAIALSDDHVSAKEGLERTHQFVQAMGRFGKGAYLCPLYGGGSEIAQAFCRVCAVYGGIYILNQPLDKYSIDAETKQINGVVTKEGQVYKCEKIIAGMDYLSTAWKPEEFGTWVSRAIVVTDAPLADLQDGLGYSVFPPKSEAGNTDEPIYTIHQSQESMACPKGQYVIYLWTASKEKSVVKNAVQLLLQTKNEQGEPVQKANCIFSAYYDQRSRNVQQLNSVPHTVIPCSDPDHSLTFQTAFEEALQIFHQCESDAEFMPAAEEQEQDD